MKQHNLYSTLLSLLLLCMVSLASAADYYWVNGEGDWSDLNHWAQTSGGSILHINVPGPLDNVFFDDNSFTADGVVYITAENATCHDFTCLNSSKNITISTTNNIALRIFGSLTLTENIICNMAGPLEFRAEESAGIFTAGIEFNSNLFFLGENGEWNLQSDLTTSGNIYFNYGVLNSANFKITSEAFSSVNTHSRSLNLGESEVNTYSWEVITENLTLDADETVLNIGSLMSTANGPVVEYNIVNVATTNGTVIHQDSKASYSNITFEGAYSTLQGQCYAENVLFKSIGTIINIDTIKNTIIKDRGAIHGEQNASCFSWLQVDSAAVISGECTIDTALLNYKAIIDGQNKIHFCKVKNECSIKGQNSSHHFIMQNNGAFIQNNTFDSLMCEQGYVYRFYGGSNTTITQHMDLQGACEYPITMQTDTNGITANITLPSFSEGEYVSCRDIKVQGGSLNLSEAIDLGNNQGISFQESNPRTLYWTSGSDGTWHDAQNWSLSAGGPGGECSPREIDDVYLSSNATIIIDQPKAVCHDLNMTTYNFSGSLIGTDTNSISVYGSVELSSTCGLLSVPGGLFFESETIEEILTNDIPIQNKIKFNGIDGTWDLFDDISCLDSIFLIYGTLNTMGNKVSTQYFNTDTQFERTLDITDTEFNITGPGIGWKLQDSSLTLNAQNSHIRILESSQLINNGSKRLHFHKLTGYSPYTLCISESPYSIFHTMHFHAKQSEIMGGFKADSVIFMGAESKVTGSIDSLRVVLFHGPKSEYYGAMNVSEYVWFKKPGVVEGYNKIDTCLFIELGEVLNNNSIDTCFVGLNGIINGGNTINKAVLRGNGNILGENTFGDLYLTPKKEYYFEAEKTQKIDNRLFCNGYCSSYILLHSDSTNSSATLEINNKDINGNYLILRDIHATGDHTYLAENSIDMGNNDGWIMPPPAGEAKYWVNGEGLWSDSTHWANTSGGQGGVCLPTAYDDVFFDNNSFSSDGEIARIDVSTAFCRNMTWIVDNAEPFFFAVDTNALMIHGSLELCNAMTWNLQCPVWFKTQLRGNSVYTLNKPFLNRTYFEGESGDWTIQREFTSTDSIYLISGSLTFTDTVTAPKFESVTTYPRSIHFEDQHLKLNNWVVNAENLNLYADRSTLISQGLVSTYDGDNIKYHNIEFRNHSGTLKSYNTGTEYQNVLFEDMGTISGSATIDSVISLANTTIYGNDTIDYLLSTGELQITSEKSFIQYAAVLYDGATIEGSNVIDTCIINGNASIQGSNSFDSCYIQNRAMIFGTNSFNKVLIIGGDAYIYEENLFDFAWLKGDGNVGGTNQFEHLRFSPGRTYKFETGDTQYINEQFEIRGNNCFPITFQSSVPGDEGFVSMPNEVMVEGDYIEMRDMHGIGGATYYAGGHSTDHANNIGWSFENAPGYIYGLMPDTSICPGTTLYINTNNFNGDDSTTFTWQDGSTGPIYATDQTGDVIVSVHYADNCIVDDTIKVTVFPEYHMTIETEDNVCEGDTIHATTDILYPVYQWPDGTTEDFYIAQTAGMITGAAIDENNCPVHDTAFVEVKPAPYVYLGEDIMLEDGETIILDAGTDGTEYNWSTGETSQRIEVSEESQYWVTVYKEGCSAMDTIFIGEYMIGIPTAFSPNGDGKNETLGILGTGFELIDFVIVSRQGQTVFRTSNPDQKWDGTYNGKPQEMGVYMYMIRFKTKSSEDRIMKGNITLLR